MYVVLWINLLRGGCAPVNSGSKRHIDNECRPNLFLYPAVENLTANFVFRSRVSLVEVIYIPEEKTGP